MSVIIDENAEPFDSFYMNYAYSVGADIMIVNSVSKEIIRQFNKDVISWKKEKNYSAFMRVREFASEQFGSFDFSTYEYITFVTDGIPYGILYNDIVCCSHILRDLRPDVFIFNNVMYENKEKLFGIALVFSPEPPDLMKGAVEEKENITMHLRKYGVDVKVLDGKRATIKTFDEHLEMYPYDIMHIISHGGKVEGYAVTSSFFDRDGNTHVVDYEEVIEVNQTTATDCTVSKKIIFKYST